jgi:hypothetical protein
MIDLVGDEMMVRLVPCGGVRECRQALIDQERETETPQTRKERKNNSIT